MALFFGRSILPRKWLAKMTKNSAGHETFFLLVTPPPGTFYGGSCGIALNSTTRRHPRLGLVAGPRGPAQIHIRGLRHWAGEPAGHLGAESPSRRTAGPASARKTSPPCPHGSHGSFLARCANAMSRCLCALPVASSRRSLTCTLGHSQWPKPPRFVHATAPARWRLLKSHTALARSDHSAATEEPAPPVTLPPTSVHVIVWCGNTPVVLHSLNDQCERHKRASRAWSACWPRNMI